MYTKFLSSFRFLNTSSKRFCSGFTSITDEQAIHKKFMNLYMRYLDLSKEEAKQFLNKNPAIWGGEDTTYKEIESTLKYLKSNYRTSEILSRPTSILINPSTYENRKQVLEECLFQNIQLFYFIRYISMMNKNVTVLKAYNYINQSGDVIENLISQLNLPIRLEKRHLNERMPLNEIRKEIMNLYLQERLQMSEEQINKTRSVYKNLKHRSFKSVIQVLDILINELNFDRDKIISNSYLLHARPENIRAIIDEIPFIADVEIKQILQSRPKIMMQNCENIKATIAHVRNFNIPEISVVKCHEVLTLSSDTVYNRLAELHKIQEFSVMFTNPRVLRLIHYQTKAKSRLEYLKQLKMRCFSVSLLSGPTEVFERYAYLGGDKTKGKEIIAYLHSTFNLPVRDIRALLCVHPNWVQVPILSVKKTTDFLRYSDFSNEDIIANMHILLYPVSRIKPKLEELMEWKTENDNSSKINSIDIKTLSNCKILSLCLYFIEAEYHFTGDAIYEVNKLDNKIDPTLMPPIPKPLMERKIRFGRSESTKVAQANAE